MNLCSKESIKGKYQTLQKTIQCSKLLKRPHFSMSLISVHKL